MLTLEEIKNEMKGQVATLDIIKNITRWYAWYYNKDTQNLMVDFKEYIKSLIENNPHLVNLKDENGDTLLHFVIENVRHKEDAEELLIALLKCGANPNTADKEGNTPFMLAIIEDEMHYAKLLAANGANIHLVNNQGENALLIAARVGGNIDKSIIELIKMGCDPFSTNKQGTTLLHIIFSENPNEESLNFAQELVDQGHNINALDNKGNTIWHYYGGNKHFRDQDDEFTLHNRYCQFLLAFVDVNKKNYKGVSPLFGSYLNDDNFNHSYAIIASGADLLPDKIITEMFEQWENKPAKKFLQIMVLGKIADSIYIQHPIHINDPQLLKDCLSSQEHYNFSAHLLLNLRIENLALKNGMPLNLDQHIDKFVHFSENLPSHFQAIKEELIKYVKNIVKSKEEMGLMIEPVLSALLHNYKPTKYPLAPYSALENMAGKMEDVESFENYDSNFKSENSIDYLFNPQNREKIYPILLADDQNRNELVNIVKSFVLYKSDHRLREKFIEDCKMLDNNTVRFLYKRVIKLETQLAEQSTKSLIRTKEKIETHAGQILEQRNKKAKTLEKID